MNFTPEENNILTAALAVYSNRQLKVAAELGDHPSRTEHENYAKQAQALMTKIYAAILNGEG